MATKTLKVRVKDKHIPDLEKQARSVNFVWNYVNQLSHRSIKEKGKFLSTYDIHEYTTGASKLLGLHSQTIQLVTKEYVTRRIQFKKAKLAWRKSSGTHKSLGWIPFNTDAAEWKNGQVYFNKNYYKVWDSYGLSMLLKHGANIHHSCHNRTMLHVASFDGNKEITEILLANGAKINLNSDLCSATLLLASSNGHAEVVKVLIDNGADIYVSNKEGNTAVTAALFYGHDDVLKYILDASIVQHSGDKMFDLKTGKVIFEKHV